MRTPKAIAPKIVVNAVEGFGKTTLLSYAPTPMILMARGETGYDTLLSAGRVPVVAADVVESWSETLAWLDALNADPQGIKTLGLDAMGGFERLCHEFVCARDFGNDWSDKGFGSYQKGYEIGAAEFAKLLQRLEHINQNHSINIVILGHSRVTNFKNPLGPDYDQFAADCHKYTWNYTNRWADAVLFGKFFTVIDAEKRGRGKGIGGTDRVLYTEHRDAYYAKNRYGMPPEIWLNGVGPEGMWSAIYSHIEGNNNAAS